MTIKKKPTDWGALAVKTPLSPGEIEQKAGEFLAQMTLKEKIRQMSGDLFYFPDGIPCWGIQPTPFQRGRTAGWIYPASDLRMAHAVWCCTMPPAIRQYWRALPLGYEAGSARRCNRVEARSMGANYYGGVCINLLRHPAWGRAQETYGEDPYLLGELGAALTRGVQRHIMACAKHYALNSIENARYKVDVQVDERTLREVYLPHFKRCVDEGIASIMSAYNKVNGEWCSHHTTLLRQISRRMGV